MRLVVVGPIIYDYSNSIVRELRLAGHEIVFYPTRDFYLCTEHWKKKLTKLGITSYKKKFMTNWELGLINVCDDYQPDVMLFLSGDMINKVLLEKLNKYRKAIWLWDSIRRQGFLHIEELVSKFSHVFCFEYSDVIYLNKKYVNIKTKFTYLPLGFDEQIFKDDGKVRDIDISFIGCPYFERRKLLEKIAEFIYKRKGTMFVGGPWYGNHFWKKIQFANKYPYLSKYVQTGMMSARESSNIYSRSKICLNINTIDHKSLNPRTFEILATNTLCLMNEGQQSNGVLDLKKDLVEYTDEMDMFTKLDYYLDHDGERCGIALCGCMDVKQYSMKKCVERCVNQLG